MSLDVSLINKLWMYIDRPAKITAALVEQSDTDSVLGLHKIFLLILSNKVIRKYFAVRPISPRFSIHLSNCLRHFR